MNAAQASQVHRVCASPNTKFLRFHLLVIKQTLSCESWAIFEGFHHVFCRFRQGFEASNTYPSLAMQPCF